jgi:hypothetical protein
MQRLGFILMLFTSIIHGMNYLDSAAQTAAHDALTAKLNSLQAQGIALVNRTANKKQLISILIPLVATTIGILLTDFTDLYFSGFLGTAFIAGISFKKLIDSVEDSHKNYLTAYRECEEFAHIIGETHRMPSNIVDSEYWLSQEDHLGSI